MADYNKLTTKSWLNTRTRNKPAAPELTKAAAMRMQRDRYGAMSKRGMTAAEMCRAMDNEELTRNARKGGLAAIAEEAFRAGIHVPPDPELDIGV